MPGALKHRRPVPSRCLDRECPGTCQGRIHRVASGQDMLGGVEHERPVPSRSLGRECSVTWPGAMSEVVRVRLRPRRPRNGGLGVGDGETDGVGRVWAITRGGAKAAAYRVEAHVGCRRPPRTGTMPSMRSVKGTLPGRHGSSGILRSRAIGLFRRARRAGVGGPLKQGRACSAESAMGSPWHGRGEARGSNRLGASQVLEIGLPSVGSQSRRNASEKCRLGRRSPARFKLLLRA